MTPRDLLTNSVDPALGLLADITLARIPVSDQARVLIMAVAGQESDWQGRRQVGGPARSFWQFEKGGGVAQLFGEEPALLAKVCDYLFVPFNEDDVFEAMAWCDVLAAAMARLLLWTDPKPLPAVGDVENSWNYYYDNWRPGSPRPTVWAGNYATAKALL